jgi:hypothetical protein
MIGSEHNRQDGTTRNGAAEAPDGLSFSVELSGAGDAAERVLGRASSAALAHAIFQAAIGENPGKRVILRRGQDIVEDSRG